MLKESVGKNIYLSVACVWIKSCGESSENLNANSTCLWGLVVISQESRIDGRGFMLHPFVSFKFPVMEL